MRSQLLIAGLLLSAALAAGAAGRDVNNPTGQSGLIMIDKQGGLVRFFDPATLTEISHLGITGTPHELAISPDHKWAYVPDYGNGVYGRNPNPGHSIAVIDLAAHTLSKTIDIAPYQAPHGLQVDAQGVLYAVCDLSRKLLIIDPMASAVKAAIDTDGTGHWVAVLPDGSKAYVANKNDRPFVSVIDLRSHKMMGKVPMPQGTQGITVAPDGKHVVAVDLAEPRLVIIDTASDTVVDSVVINNMSHGLWRARYSPDGEQLLISNVAERSVVALSSANLHGEQRIFKVGSQPFGIAFSPDALTAVISNHGDGTISVIDLRAGAVVETVTAGVGIETLSYY